MAHSCLSTLSFNPFVSTPTNPSSAFEQNLNSSSFLPVHSRKGSKSRGIKKNLQTSLCSRADDYDDFWTPERRGIWSIRDDLVASRSPQVRNTSQGWQGPNYQMEERFFSVVTQLFQYRIIRCGGPVEDDMANIIVAQLLYLDAIDPKKDIVLYINSPGGSVTAGMAIFDTMKHIRPDVSTVCVGLAASMASFLLCSGTKGKRFSLPNSRIMIHQPIAEIDGALDDLLIQENEILHHKANLAAYFSYFTGQSLEKINADTEVDFFMSPKEAMEYGLIDGIISNPYKAFQPQSSPA